MSNRFSEVADLVGRDIGKLMLWAAVGLGLTIALVGIGIIVAFVWLIRQLTF